MTDNKFETLSEAIETAFNSLTDDEKDNNRYDSGAENWDIYDLYEMAQTMDNDELDGYYVVGYDGSVGYTENDGVNVEWLYNLIG